MSIATPHETPARAGTPPSNPNSIQRPGMAAESRSQNGTESFPREAIENLKGKLNGRIVLPADSDYDAVRQIWNAMIERRPALIVRCADARDVPHAIRLRACLWPRTVHSWRGA